MHIAMGSFSYNIAKSAAKTFINATDDIRKKEGKSLPSSQEDPLGKCDRKTNASTKPSWGELYLD